MPKRFIGLAGTDAGKAMVEAWTPNHCVPNKMQGKS